MKHDFKYSALFTFDYKKDKSYSDLKVEYYYTYNDTIELVEETLFLINRIELYLNKPFYFIKTREEVISYFDYNFRDNIDKKMLIIVTMNNFCKFLVQSGVKDANHIKESIFFRNIYEFKLLFKKHLATPIQEIIDYSVERKCIKIRTVFELLRLLVYEYRLIDVELLFYAVLSFLGTYEDCMEIVQINQRKNGFNIEYPLYNFCTRRYDKAVYRQDSRLERLLFDAAIKRYGQFIGSKLLTSDLSVLKSQFHMYSTQGRTKFISTFDRKYNCDRDELDNKMFKPNYHNMKFISVINKFNKSKLDDFTRKEIESKKITENISSYCRELMYPMYSNKKMKIYFDIEDLITWIKINTGKYWNNNPIYKMHTRVII